MSMQEHIWSESETQTVEQKDEEVNGSVLLSILYTNHYFLFLSTAK